MHVIDINEKALFPLCINENSAHRCRAYKTLILFYTENRDYGINDTQISL